MYKNQIQNRKCIDINNDCLTISLMLNVTL